MKIKYQITMEVEIEVDNLNDKKTNNANMERLTSRAAGFANHIYQVTKIDVSRTGATGVTPRVIHQSDAAGNPLKGSFIQH